MMKKKYNCKNTGVEIIQVLAASIKLLNVDMLIHANSFHLLLSLVFLVYLTGCCPKCGFDIANEEFVSTLHILSSF